jgi:ubiquinone/menaquinone biosynthesis C-methylase UbiE
VKNDFDKIARIYDTLARIVFGSVWRKVQLAPLGELNKSRNVLIVGGGTGRMLCHLDENVNVTYLELSQKMIDKAKMRETTAQVEFVKADFLLWQTESKYDCVLMPFFLDCFTEHDMIAVINRTKSLLHQDGKLIVTDFQDAGLFRNQIVKLMYWFFNVVSGLKGKTLLDFQTVILTRGYQLNSTELFLNSWIFHSVYTTKK